MSSLPPARGPLTFALFDALRHPPHALDPLPRPDSREDEQLALYCCYELHYRGFDDVDERWEWSPTLIAARTALEEGFEAELRALVPTEPFEREPDEMDLALREIADGDAAPSVSRYIEGRASEEQLLEFVVHRSAYQLKEA